MRLNTLLAAKDGTPPLYFALVTWLCYSDATRETARKLLSRPAFLGAKHGDNIPLASAHAIAARHNIELFHGDTPLPATDAAMYAYVDEMMRRTYKKDTRIAEELGMSFTILSMWRKTRTMKLRRAVHVLTTLYPDIPVYGVRYGADGRIREDSRVWAFQRGIKLPHYLLPESERPSLVSAPLPVTPDRRADPGAWYADFKAEIAMSKAQQFKANPDTLSEFIPSPADIHEMEKTMAETDTQREAQDKYATSHLTNTFIHVWRRVKLDTRQHRVPFPDGLAMPADTFLRGMRCISAGVADRVEFLLGEQPVDMEIGATSQFIEEFLRVAVDTSPFSASALDIPDADFAAMRWVPEDSPASTLDLSVLPAHKLFWLLVELGLQPQVRVTLHGGVVVRVPLVVDKPGARAVAHLDGLSV